MAGASDKARFYLEQYVPELQEYQRKNIFSRAEITAITSKRSDFEHALNARGSKPSHYARYATYEMNLDSLRKKRCKRLGVKSTAFSGQRTIFFILDRATRKFPGDVGLWMQYIHFCQSERANKKLAKVFTSVLRLKPREWGLWVLAAKHYAEGEGDVNTARSYMQRGLRFCRDERRLWVEYVRLEMGYLAKLAARRRILGLDGEEKDGGQKQGDEDGDTIMLPTVTAEDIDPDASKGVNEVDDGALQKLASAPVFTGAIPIAIFDAAMKQFKNDAEVAEDFLDTVASFDQVPSARRILQHIPDHLQTTAPNSAETVICEAKLQLFAIEAQSADFPAALRASLVTVRRAVSKFAGYPQPKLLEKVVLLLLSYLKMKEDLDIDVTRVLESSMRRYLRMLPRGAISSSIGGVDQVPLKTLTGKLLKDGREADANILAEYGKEMDLV